MPRRYFSENRHMMTYAKPTRVENYFSRLITKLKQLKNNK